MRVLRMCLLLMLKMFHAFRGFFYKQRELSRIIRSTFLYIRYSVQTHERHVLYFFYHTFRTHRYVCMCIPAYDNTCTNMEFDLSTLNLCAITIQTLYFDKNKTHKYLVFPVIKDESVLISFRV